MARRQYYDKRQVINVIDFETIDFDDRILICVPHFAWIVARSYLSLQAQWNSSYAIEYYSDGYETPTSGQMDVIQANLAEFLGASDMSCDLEAAMNLIVDALEQLVAKSCSVELSCTQGAGGAGGTAEPGEIYEDIGEEPPSGFPTYEDYQDFKCQMAKLLINQMIADMNYIITLQIVEMTATIFAASLLTPIPGDEIAVFVGAALIALSAGLLAGVLTNLAEGLEEDIDDLICQLILATDVSGAKVVLETWARVGLSDTAQFLFSFWLSTNNLNRLFQSTNAIFTSHDCDSCELPADSIKDTFTDDDDVLLTAHTQDQGTGWLTPSTGVWTIEENQAMANGVTNSTIMTESSFADGQVSAILTPGSRASGRQAFQGVVARGSDLANYISAGWHGGATAKYWIAKTEASVRTELDSVETPTHYDPRVLTLTCEGENLALYVNGVPTCTAESDFNEEETRWGMRLGEAGLATMDNFLAESIA